MEYNVFPVVYFHFIIYIYIYILMVTHDWNQIAFANLNSTIPSFWCETPNIGKESYLVEQIRTTCDFLKTELHQPTLKYWSAQESHSILENGKKKKNLNSLSMTVVTSEHHLILTNNIKSVWTKCSVWCMLTSIRSPGSGNWLLNRF